MHARVCQRVYFYFFIKRFFINNVFNKHIRIIKFRYEQEYLLITYIIMYNITYIFNYVNSLKIIYVFME